MAVDQGGLAAEFARSGVVVLPGFFDAATLQPLTAAMARLVAASQPWTAELAASRGAHKDRYKRLFETELMSLPLRTEEPEAAAVLLEEPRLAAVTERVLGAGYSQSGPMCFGYGRAMQHGWHQVGLPRDARAPARPCTWSLPLAPAPAGSTPWL